MSLCSHTASMRWKQLVSSRLHYTFLSPLFSLVSVNPSREWSFLLFCSNKAVVRPSPPILWFQGTQKETELTLPLRGNKLVRDGVPCSPGMCQQDLVRKLKLHLSSVVNQGSTFAEAVLAETIGKPNKPIHPAQMLHCNRETTC